jgi:hypothetical protein
MLDTCILCVLLLSIVWFGYRGIVELRHPKDECPACNGAGGTEEVLCGLCFGAGRVKRK